MPRLKACHIVLAMAMHRSFVLPRTTKVPGMETSYREVIRRYRQVRRGEDAWQRFTLKADDPSPVLIADVGWSLMPVQVPTPC